MYLLDIETIRIRLDEQFKHLEPMLMGLRLVAKCDQRPGLEECETKLNLILPTEYSDLVTQFDFGHLTLGPVAFCNTGDYFAWLIRTNLDAKPNNLAWWSGTVRPRDWIMIANSDILAIVMNCSNGQVSAFTHGSATPDGFFLIASRFDLFFRGIGTAMLERHSDEDNTRLAQSVAEAVGVNPDNEFWRFITR